VSGPVTPVRRHSPVGGYIWWRFGIDRDPETQTGYLVEKSFSVDEQLRAVAAVLAGLTFLKSC
jgi:hypothetical protein